MLSVNLRKNLEIGKDSSDEKISEIESVKLTEWLIFKIKTIYGRSVFEGDTPEEASAIRKEWQDLVVSIGKKGVLATIDYLLSGHHAVPSFPPAPVEFKKCYRSHVSRTVTKISFQQHSEPLTKEQKQMGYQCIKEILVGLKTGCLGGNIQNLMYSKSQLNH